MKHIYAYILLVGYTVLTGAQEMQKKSDQLLAFALFGTMKPLTSEKQYLADRINQETALAVKGTILDNNSLPTTANLQEWVDAFVKVYESPYVLSRLKPEEKAQYIQKIYTFFSNSFLKNIDPVNADNDVTALQELYTSLPSRLKAAIRIRMIPALETGINEAKLKVLELQKQFNQYAEVEKQIQSKLAATTDPQEKSSLQKSYQKVDSQLSQINEEGLKNAFILSLYSALLSVIM